MKKDKYYSVKSSIILFLMWMLLFWTWLWILISTMNYIYNWEKVTGTVTHLEVHEDDDWDTYRPTVKYTCAWRTVERSTSSASSSYDYSVGSHVTIYCMPSRPEKFYIKWSNTTLLIFLWFFGFLVGWIWTRAISKEIKQLLLKKRLKKEWVIVKAKVESINRTNVGISWCYITAKSWNDSYKTYTLSPSIRYLVKPWDDINVYIDIQNHNKYRVDSDTIRENQIQWQYIKETLLGNKWTENKNDTIPYDKLVEHTEVWKKLQKWISSDWLTMLLLFIFWCLLSLSWGSYLYEIIFEHERHFDSGYIILWILGFWMLWFLIWMIYSKIKRKTLKKRLKREWIAVEWIITEIQNTWVKVNDQSWYIILALYWNELYKSQRIYKNVYSYVKKWDAVAIYIDTQDPRKYWMDIETVKSRKEQTNEGIKEGIKEGINEQIISDI